MPWLPEATRASCRPATRAGHSHPGKNCQLEKLLPQSEKAADDCEKALAAFQDSTDANVRTAVDGALLRIAAVHSLRTGIAKEPALAGLFPKATCQ